MANLATPTFLSGAQDELATLDVYKEAGSQTVNSIEDYFSSFNKESLGKLLKGGKSVLSLLPAIKSLSKLNFSKLDTKSLLTQVTKMSSSVSSALKVMGAGDQTSILTKIGEAGGSFTSEINGIVSKIPYGKLASVQGVAGLINSFAPELPIKINDYPGVAKLIEGASAVAARAGLPNSLTGLLSSNISLDNKTLLKIAKAAGDELIKSSDIGSLKALSGKLKVGELVQALPNLTKDLSNNFKKPFECTANDLPEVHSSVMDLYSSADPSWNIASWGNGSIPNLTGIMGSSDDFKEVIKSAALTSTDINAKVQLLATEFKESTPSEDIQKYFPTTQLEEVTPSTKPASAEIPGISDRVESAIKIVDQSYIKAEELMGQKTDILKTIDWSKPVEAASLQKQIEAIDLQLTKIQKYRQEAYDVIGYSSK